MVIGDYRFKRVLSFLESTSVIYFKLRKEQTSMNITNLEMVLQDQHKMFNTNLYTHWNTRTLKNDPIL